MRKILFFITSFLSLFAESPESKIIVVENFLPQEMADALMRYYDAEKKNLNVPSDNELSFSSVSNSQIRRIIFEISDRVIRLMQQSYPLTRTYQLDHCGLYARIAGNSCGYHADNIFFECPVHGKNQGALRKTCNGTCAGAKYVPNHTSWREYTALIYLNDAFEGGEILFEDGPANRQYRKVIPIRKNLLILAPNGKDYYHEVFAIRKGKRYSLHLWYTSDPKHFHWLR